MITLILLTIVNTTHANTYFTACQKDAASAQAACGPSDRYEGMDSPDKVRSLLEDINRYGAFVQKSAACGQIPAHFDNQKKMANAIAQLSDAKAAACSKTLAQCQSMCTESAFRYDNASEVYGLLALSDKAADASNKSQQSQSADSTCASYAKNVADFRSQAAKARQDEQASLVGYHKSLQDNPGASNGNPECSSSQIVGQSQGGTSRAGALPFGNSLTPKPHQGPDYVPLPSFNLTQRPEGSTDPASAGATSRRQQQISFGTSAAAGGAVESKSLTQRPRASEGSIPANNATGGAGSMALPKPRVDAESRKHFRSLASVRGEFIAPSDGKNSIPSEATVIGMRPSANLNTSAGAKVLSGRSASLPDGITPALGPGLFEKVSSQYRKQASNLKMD